MAQINLHTTPEFEQQLGELMCCRSILSKSEAIRMAVAAQAKAAQWSQCRRDFSVLTGLMELEYPSHFFIDDALWEKDATRGN